MNERIEELYKQSFIEVQDENSFPCMTFSKQKFAELIVMECMEVCKSRVGNSDYNTGRMHCASDLKEHFGVEE